MSPLAFIPSVTARVERITRSGGLSFVADGSESSAMSHTPPSSRAQSFVRRSRGATPNHALQRTRPSRRGCNPTPSWAGSLSLGRSARQCSYSPDDYLTDCRDNFFATIFLPLVVAHMPSDSMAKKCRAKNQLPTKTVETMEASRTLQNESQTLSASARFVCNAGCLTGGSDTLQASLAKSWIALPCIHADINRHRVAARHQDSYNDRGSIRRTDNSNA